ncbi:MAG TPA: hypothetical protein VLC91_16825 [Spongiibacteraceae bacterium]|nr:hypothetical protein [Spongiibacteraceae bacterium]
MPVPTTMTDLSTAEASNSPSGGEQVGPNLDNYLRAIQAILRTTNAKGADIASAATTNIGAATGEFVDVTGTTTITSLGTVAAGITRTVRFTGALTLTHNATSLILPEGTNIITAANDVAVFRSLGSGNWVLVSYSKDTSPSGVYTPTITNFANASGITAHQAMYFKVGNIFAVAGAVTFTPTAAAFTDMNITLPFTSNIGSNFDILGMGVTINALVVSQFVRIEGNPGTDRAELSYIASNAGSQTTCTFIFVGRILP